MATSLRCVFRADGNQDRRITVTFNHADITATGAQVKTLMEAMIDNKEIYADEPGSIVGAEFVARAVIPVDVD